MSENKKVTIATSWLDGCSGCHMSVLDMDARLIELADKIDIVYGPLVDAKQIPDEVDVAIIEGAIANEDDLAKAKKLREHCGFVIALGDCAVSGNVHSMRNVVGKGPAMDRAFKENVDGRGRIPKTGVPALLDRVTPVHEAIKVDLFVQGCPPPADAIHFVLSELLQGRLPDPTQLTRFGA